MVKKLAFLSVFLVHLPALAAPRPVKGSIRIIEVNAFDNASTAASSATTSIDVEQGSCVNGTTTKPEPFSDTLLKIKVTNNSSNPVTLRRFSFSISSSNGGEVVRGRRASIVNGGYIPSKGTGEVVVLFLDANNGSKFTPGGTDIIQSGFGFGNVTVRLEGRNAFGHSIKLSSRTSLSFDNFDKCTSS